MILKGINIIIRNKKVKIIISKELILLLEINIIRNKKVKEKVRFDYLLLKIKIIIKGINIIIRNKKVKEKVRFDF